MSLEIGKVTNRVQVQDDSPAKQSARTSAGDIADRLRMSQTELVEFLRPILRTLLDEELRRFQRSRG